MNHTPSDYQGTITLTYQQMWEVHKAISARITHFSIHAKDSMGFEIDTLLAVAEMLEAHEQAAVNAWEEKVARREAEALDDQNALNKFLNDDKESE